MAEKEKKKPDEPPFKSSPLINLLWQGVQGITFVGVLTVLAAGFTWKGEIQTKLEEQTKTLDKISDSISNTDTGMAVRLVRIETKVNSLEDWSKTISPKIVKSDFDQEINRLNARISDLQKQLTETKQNLQTTQANLAQERDASNLLRGRVETLQAKLREATQSLEAAKAELARQSNELELSQGLHEEAKELDSQLSNASQELASLEEQTKSPKTQLTEEYRSSLVERLTKLQKELENVRRQIKHIAS